MALSDSILIEDLRSTVIVGEEESLSQAKSRAYEILRLSAIEKAPKYISLNSQYDSRTDEIIELASTIQAGTIEVKNERISKSISSEGRIIVTIQGDALVDSSNIKKKIKSTKREKLLKQVISEMKVERLRVKGLLERLDQGEGITEDDSRNLTKYRAILGAEFTVAGEDEIEDGNRAKQSFVQKHYRLWDLYYLEFIRRTRFKYSITATKELAYDVVQLDLEFEGTPQISWQENEFRTFDNITTDRPCDSDLFRCSRFGLEIQNNGQFRNDPSLAKRLNQPFLFLRNGSCNAFDYRYVGKWDKGDVKYCISWKIRDKDFFSALLERMKATVFFLEVKVGPDTYRMRLEEKRAWKQKFNFSVFLPKEEVEGGVIVNYRVVEERYDVNTDAWFDLGGKFQRFLSDQIKFYKLKNRE